MNKVKSFIIFACLICICLETTAQTVSKLEIYNVETGQRTVLKAFPYKIEAPNWTTDGKSLIYNSGGKLYRININRPEDDREINTGFAVNCNNDHVLSAKGNRIAISHGTKEDGKSRIYITSLDGGTPSLITPLAPSYLHGWSPDEKTLTYCAERKGNYDIYAIPAEGGVETRLTTAESLDDGPEYAPDGKQVVYIAYNKEEVAASDHPSGKNVELRIMPVKGGEAKTIVRLFGGQGTINVNSWSPDSKCFAFVSYIPSN